MEFALNLGINRTSLGQVSINLLKEIYKRGYEPCVFNIGDIDLTTHKKDEDFNKWLTNCIQKSLSSHKRDIPIFKNWHLSGGLESFSKDQCLFTYLETDRATETELNVINNQKVTFVCNEYLQKLLTNQGAKNVVYCPLGYDSESFYNTRKKCYNDDRIVWGIAGKFEQRKGHLRAIRAWIKKYGRNSRHVLHLAITNNFLNADQNNHILNLIFEGKKPFNVNVLPIMATNKEYNDILNTFDIVIDAAHNETWSLPSFQAIGMGKWGVLHNAAGISQWSTHENSIQFNSNGKMIPAADNMFFNSSGPFSQGEYFDWNEEDLISAMERAETLAKTPNLEGEKLREQFTYSKSLDIILENLK